MGNVHMTPAKPGLLKNQVVETSSTASQMNNKNVKSDQEYDIFRDSLVRYMGYTNEVGEAFRRHISRRMLYASYAAVTGYVCADTIHKAYGSIERNESLQQTIITAGDVIVWQMFASILIPGYVINRISYFTRRLIRLKRKKCICKASPIIRFTPVIVGLLSIPFIVHPIDTGITWAMDNTLRKLYTDANSKK